VATKALSCQPSDCARGNTKVIEYLSTICTEPLTRQVFGSADHSLIIDFRSHRTHCLPVPRSPLLPSLSLTIRKFRTGVWMAFDPSSASEDRNGNESGYNAAHADLHRLSLRLEILNNLRVRTAHPTSSDAGYIAGE